MEVFYIDVSGEAIVRSPIISSNCYGRKGDKPINLTGSPFYISIWNSFIAVGCDIRALLMDDPLLRIGCDSRCNGQKDIDLREMLPKLQTIDSNGYILTGSDFNGTDCCKTSLPSDNQMVFHPIFNQSTDGCKLAFLAIDGGGRFDQFLVPRHPYVQFLMLLDWRINSTLMRAVDKETAYCYNNGGVNASEFQFNCRCRESGHEGNPYIGCADIDECVKQQDYFCQRLTKCVNTYGSYKCVPDPKWIIIIVVCGVIGVLTIPFGCWRLYKLIKKIRNIQLKKKFFKRNGGLLLKQQLTLSDGGVHKTKLFSSKELEKATNRFCENMILGQGGQGTVYKGMLTDGRIVAIKKSKLVDEGKISSLTIDFYKMPHKQ
ncbi:hypothetical protein GH714_026757 [Hevea brasiliensis]|uniref:EGF-like calcium-binding domain-containing protein n=1 Tax=Hevea brasiliensis TaxID=3981 RepID=A0A6A6LND1_HEVBR|nr:hypothetical protein GH714_026757 [Hevea brasiliensis]